MEKQGFPKESKRVVNELMKEKGGWYPVRQDEEAFGAATKELISTSPRAPELLLAWWISAAAAAGRLFKLVLRRQTGWLTLRVALSGYWSTPKSKA